MIWLRHPSIKNTRAKNKNILLKIFIFKNIVLLTISWLWFDCAKYICSICIPFLFSNYASQNDGNFQNYLWLRDRENVLGTQLICTWNHCYTSRNLLPAGLSEQISTDATKLLIVPTLSENPQHHFLLSSLFISPL